MLIVGEIELIEYQTLMNFAQRYWIILTAFNEFTEQHHIHQRITPRSINVVH